MDPNARGCNVRVESRWGPVVSRHCLNGFDFTLLFEESILTILPVCFFSLWSLLRIYALLKEPARVYSAWLLPCKLACYGVYVALQAALIGLFATIPNAQTPTSVAASVLLLVGHLVFATLSWFDHQRSWRPSTVLGLYFTTTLLLDMARVRTLWLISSSRAIPSLLLAAYCVKIVLIVLESTEKAAFFRHGRSAASREDAAGILDRLTFLWINSLFGRGFRGILSVKTLLDIDHDLLDASEPETLCRRWDRANKQGKYALLWTFTWHYKWTVLAGVPPKLAYVGFQFAQPFLIQRVLDFLDQPADMPNRQSIAYGLIGAYALVYIGIAISYTYTEHKTDRLVLKFRGSLVTLIFDKTLRMHSTAVSDASALTLMSADVDRVGNGLRLLHDTWSAFIEAAIALWLLESLLGIAVIAPALFIVVILGLGLPIGNLAGNAQGDWLEAIEKRIGVTSKAIGSFRNIKMTGATGTVRKIIMALRENEIHQSGKYRWYLALTITVAYLADAFTPLLGFGTYILLSYYRHTETLTQGIGFAALTLFQLLDSPMALLIDGAQELKTVVNCFSRIQEHLNEAERIDVRAIKDCKASEASSEFEFEKEKPVLDEKRQLQNDLVVARGVSTSYESSAEPVLKDATFTIRRSAVTMVVGPVGSGKTTFLNTLISEAPNTTGELKTTFRHAAHCPQAPWLKFGTVQENILGSSSWDGPWYATVTAACGLDVDFAELADGDRTKAGSRGSRLSGGQQKRIALARALYAREDVLILDDVLTGLDRRTEQKVLDAVFAQGGLLRARGASVVLATNSANQLPYADEIIVLTEDGRVARQGSFEQLSATSTYIAQITTAHTATADDTNAKPGAATTTTATLDADAAEEVEQAELDAENEARRTGDLRTYIFYFEAAGWPLMAFFLFTACLFVFGITFPTIWVQWWTDANDALGRTAHVGYWLGVYAALGVISVLATFASSAVLLLLIVPRTARRLHARLLDTVCGARPSWLAATDAGTTTNRFSQDLELVDLDLPQVLETTVISALACVAEAALVFAGSGYVAATIPGVFAVVYLIQNFYLRTSRQLRLLDIEARAPLFSTFLEAQAGLASVRAFGWVGAYAARARAVLAASQKPYYLLFTVQRWLTLVLQLIVAGLAVLLVALATTTHGSATYLLGAALFNIVSFGSTLEQVITDWTQLEQSIGAISRIRGFVRSTPSEDEGDGDETDVSSAWPETGDIVFDEVSASYESSSEPALKSLSFEIKDGEKVAICGRTGSGKSSLVSTILRMLDIDSGTISLAGQDITTVARNTIRQRVNVLPQDPFFFRGSVRQNADPQELASDKTIISALEAVRLWDIWADKDGLDAELDEDLLSHGQRQLFCLARAICKPCRILILDEVASSADAATEKLVQDLIRDHFPTQTVIAIAHKLQSIVDYDKVVVLDAGHLLESGRPSELLKEDGSVFKALFDSLRHAD